MPVKCSQCGTENLDGALFCDECGASLTEATAQPTPAPQIETPTPSASAATALKCSSCGHENPIDARFCESCGSGLTITASGAPPVEVEAPSAPSAPPAPPVAVPVSFIVADVGERLSLDLTKEALIGRADPVSRVFPEVDLTPYGAYDSGVSRRHCRLFRQGDQFFIEDLGSTNGTRLNGQIIQPNQPTPLKDGDTLELGTLKLTFKAV